MASTNEALEKMTNYISHKALIGDADISKKEIMQRAGYTLTSATQNNLENGRNYAMISDKMINQTGFILTTYLNVLEKEVRNGAINKMEYSEVLRGAKTVLDIFKGLAPTYKQKETVKSSDGSLTTIWKTLNG